MIETSNTDRLFSVDPPSSLFDFDSKDHSFKDHSFESKSVPKTATPNRNLKFDWDAVTPKASIQNDPFVDTTGTCP